MSRCMAPKSTGLLELSVGNSWVGVSATFPEAIGEEVVEFGDGVDLGYCLFEVVGNAVELDYVAANGDVGGTGVVVTGLTDGPDVDHGFSGTEFVPEADFFRGEEFKGVCEDTRNVGVSLKTSLLDQCKDFLHLYLIVDVVRKYVLIQRIAG